MIQFSFIKNLKHRLFHKGLLVRHYVQVYAPSQLEAIKQAQSHVNKFMKSFGNVTYESAKIARDGIPDKIKVIKKKKLNPLFVVGENKYKQMNRAIKEAQKIAIAEKRPVMIDHKLENTVAVIDIQPGTMPLWVVTFLEKEKD